MNMLKLPSMVTFQMDKTLQEKRFIQNQSELNDFIKKNHKISNNYYNEAQQITGLSSANLPDLSRVKFNQSGVDSKIQGKMLEDQMRLKNLETQFDHQKSKIEDQHNAKTFRKKYPYGKQNVKITEDVIEKYRTNNYLDQSQILRKFEEQARKRKQQQKARRRGQQTISKSADQSEINLNNYYRRSLKKKTSILERQVNKLYVGNKLNEVNKLYQGKKDSQIKNNYSIDKKLYKKFRSSEKENRKFDKIENMLNQMKQKLHSNITTLSARQSERQKQKRSKKQEQISRERLQKLSQLSKQQDFYRRRLPVVIYNNQKNNQINYFSKMVCADIDNYERKDKIGKPEQFSEVINIYNMNKKRLDMLSQKVNLKDNKSTF